MLDGAVTFSKAAALHELAFDVPTDRLLLGSGAPRNLPTQAKGGRRSMCHPGHVTFVAERVAEIKAGSSGLDAAELATSAASLLTASCENAARAFGLAHHGVRRGPA